MVAKVGNLLVKDGILLRKQIRDARCPDLTVQLFNLCGKDWRECGCPPPQKQEGKKQEQGSGCQPTRWSFGKRPTGALLGHVLRFGLSRLFYGMGHLFVDTGRQFKDGLGFSFHAQEIFFGQNRFNFGKRGLCGLQITL